MKAARPCLLWPLSWNAMRTPRRRLLERRQAPLTPQRFLSLCPKLNNEWEPRPPSPLVRHSPTPRLPCSALILSLGLTCSLQRARARLRARTIGWRRRRNGELMRVGGELQSSRRHVTQNITLIYISTPLWAIGWLWAGLCSGAGPHSQGGAAETMGPVSYTKQL